MAKVLIIKNGNFSANAIKTISIDGSTPTPTTNVTISTSVTPSGGGSVSGGGSYAVGTSVTLNATPASGYKFVSWNDGITTASRTITASSNATYTATFEVDSSGTTETDITSQFDFTTNSGMALAVYDPTGSTSSVKYKLYASGVFNTSNAVNVSAYRGKTMRITSMKYTTGSGTQSSYGSAFYATTPVEDTTTPITSINSPTSSNGNSKGESVVTEITIPSTATYFVATYFNDTKKTEFGASAFSCKILA